MARAVIAGDSDGGCTRVVTSESTTGSEAKNCQVVQHLFPMSSTLSSTASGLPRFPLDSIEGIAKLPTSVRHYFTTFLSPFSRS